MNNKNNDNIDKAVKSKPVHYPGQSLDSTISDLKLHTLSYVVYCLFIAFFVFIEWWHKYFHIQPQPIPALLLAVIVIPFLLIKIRTNNKLLQNYVLGSEGEKIVGNKLEELRKYNYLILHDIVGGNFNIDHIVISPNGIFVIETKARKKGKYNADLVNNLNPSTKNYEVVSDGINIIVKGSKPDPEPIKQAIRNAEYIQKMLREHFQKDFNVIPVVVYPNFNVKEFLNDKIWVMNPFFLNWRIPTQPKCLTNEQVNGVYKHLEFLVKVRDYLETKHK